jgi:hypothetical protein
MVSLDCALLQTTAGPDAPKWVTSAFSPSWSYCTEWLRELNCAQKLALLLHQ